MKALELQGETGTSVGWTIRRQFVEAGDRTRWWQDKSSHQQVMGPSRGPKGVGDEGQLHWSNSRGDLVARSKHSKGVADPLQENKSHHSHHLQQIDAQRSERSSIFVADIALQIYELRKKHKIAAVGGVAGSGAKRWSQFCCHH
jgi:hypothetical protein